MADSFHSSKYSVDHAKRHIRNLETEASIFFGTRPYAVVVETNANGTEDAHKIKLVKPMPVSLPGIAFDALNSLRSSLDQAGYAIAIACSKSGKKAHFPFGDRADEVESRRKSSSKDLPKEIFDLMAAFKPYKGGNDLLWALNKLCNSHKHEIITPVAFYTGHMSINNLVLSGGPASFTFSRPEWDSDKNELIFARIAHGSKLDMDAQFEPCIVFADVDTVFRQPAVPIICQMGSIVESIIMALEAEATRLGIIKQAHE